MGISLKKHRGQRGASEMSADVITLVIRILITMRICKNICFAHAR